MTLSVSALVLHGLLPDSRPVRIGVRRMYVGGVFGVQGSEDLVRYPVETVAQEQRTREEERQQYPTRPPVQNRPDDFRPSHLAGSSPFTSPSSYPQGVYTDSMTLLPYVVKYLYVASFRERWRASIHELPRRPLLGHS
jgi:hypothetical protein